MSFLLTLDPARFPQVSYSCGVGVVYEFVKSSIIPAVKLELDLRANISGASYGLYVLQDEQLKNITLSNVPLLSSYAIELH